MIDPMARWAAYGEKPDYVGLMSFAGLPTYGGLPYTEDPAELEGVDAAIVGAPMDELTSDSPGTRFGPRAIRAASCAAGAHLEAGVDALRRDLQVFNEGRTGGRYWFTQGWNARAVGAWAAGSAFGLLTVNTTLYAGPLADLAGGVDLSMLGSATIAAAGYALALVLSPERSPR